CRARHPYHEHLPPIRPGPFTSFSRRRAAGRAGGRAPAGRGEVGEVAPEIPGERREQGRQALGGGGEGISPEAGGEAAGTDESAEARRRGAARADACGG